MSLKTVTFAALISVAAVGAAAAAGNPGKDQLARSLGVDGDQFTTAQLIQLQTAKRDNNAEAVRFILSQAGSDAVALSSDSAGQIQRAKTLGVEPGRFTPAELSQLETAKRNGDSEVWKFITTGANRNAANSASNPGKLQLAASLGVNADDYTLAELNALNGARNDR